MSGDFNKSQIFRNTSGLNITSLGRLFNIDLETVCLVCIDTFSWFGCFKATLVMPNATTALFLSIFLPLIINPVTWLSLIVKVKLVS